MLKAAPHKEDIKAAIHKKGSTLAAISIEAGLSDAACANALTRPVPRANHAIAQFLNISPHDLWPFWFDKYGKRIKKT